MNQRPRHNVKTGPAHSDLKFAFVATAQPRRNTLKRGHRAARFGVHALACSAVTDALPCVGELRISSFGILSTFDIRHSNFDAAGVPCS